MDASAVEQAVEQAVETVDLTAVVESMARIEELLAGVAAGQLVLAGVLLGAAVVLVLAVMWR